MNRERLPVDRVERLANATHTREEPPKAHLIEQRDESEADKTRGADLTVLLLDGRHHQLGDESMEHRVLLQSLREGEGRAWGSA